MKMEVEKNQIFIVTAVFCIIWSRFNFDLFPFKYGMNQSLHAQET